MARKPTVKVIVDGQNVQISGSTAVNVHVQIKGQPPVISGNAVSKEWYETWWGIGLIGLAVTIAGGGAIYGLGWTG